MENPVTRTIRIIIGLIAGLFVCAITIKIIYFLVRLLGAVALGAINVHLNDSPTPYRYVEDIANILAAVVGIYLWIKTYKRIVPSKMKT